MAPRLRPFLLALGSNIDPETNLPRAVAELARLLPLDAASRVFETEPVDAPGTPRFLNAAVATRFASTPHRLRDGILRPLEARLGRVRTVDPNAPRTIDIDVVFVPGLVLEDPASGLVLPDPELARRPHLALPLADIAGAELHPLLRVSLSDVAADLGRSARPSVRPDVVLRLDGTRP